MGERHGAAGPEAATAQALLALLDELSREVRGQDGAPASIGLDCDLEADLGFDSLVRAEMIQRIEQRFGVSLASQILLQAQTPRELLREIHRGGQAAPLPGPGVEALPLEAVAQRPDEARTLQQVLEWHLATHPERPHLLVYDEGEGVVTVTYRALAEAASRIAAGLVARGLAPGQTVALMLPTGLDYFHSFFGVLLARGVPVPIYPPARPSQLEEHLRRHAGILDNCQARLLITTPEALPLSRLLRSLVESLGPIVTPAALAQPAPPPRVGAPQEQDLALLQYTSGSTGQPKGVMLTHANLLANIRAMGQAVQPRPSDVFVSWLPLYHDMGLIGAWLGSLYFSLPLVVMSPLRFLASPRQWLWAIHTHRGTLSPAPNFAFELCLRLENPALAGLDLSSWRLSWNGAEPVSARTLRRFQDRFAAYGLRPDCLAPVYGLAECAVGLTFPPLGRPPRIDRIRRDPLQQQGLARPAEAGDGTALEMVSVGRPLPGYQLRIVDGGGHELPEREEGRVQFQGPSATRGYYRNPAQTRALFDGSWLNTGDLGYVAGGELFITGRTKDLIIRGGRNLHPQELEEAVGCLPGVRKGCVAVFAAGDPRAGTEKLVVLAETRETAPAPRQAIAEAIGHCTLAVMGMAADDLVLAPPGTVPKTSSGKLRRAACRERYEQGRLLPGRQAVPWQLLRLLGAGLRPQWRRGWRRLGDWGYAAYTWSLLLLFSLLIWPLVALVPAPERGWALVRRAARGLLRLSGTRLQVLGLERLPRDRPLVLVANHASYLDGLVLMAALPGHYDFVAKAELLANPITRLFLARLGTEFVERFDYRQGLADAQRLAARVGAGHSLLFFPEGTICREPGLQPFHLGAFMAAVQAGVPLVPVTLQGTRSKLRAGTWFPRRGAVSVTVGAPLSPSGDDWQAAVALRDRVRQVMLAAGGEPDLAPGRPG